MRELLARLRDWLRRDTLDRELREELAFHRAQTERDLAHVSDPHERARLSALRLGNTTNIVEASRERWSLPGLDQLMQDVRYAARGMRRNPSFTIVVVLILSLGLGANLSVFSVLDRIYIRPPAGVANPDALRRLYVQSFYENGSSDIRDSFNYPEWRDLTAGLDGLPTSTFSRDSAKFGSGATERQLRVVYSDAAYWKLLGVQPAMGRAYDSTESRVETPTRVAVLSHAFWEREFGSRPSVIGESIELSDKRHIIIGVAPKNFAGVDPGTTDVWMPLGDMPMAEGEPGVFWYQIRGMRRLQVLVRLRDEQSATAYAERATRGLRIGLIAGGFAYDSNSVISIGSLNVAHGPIQRSQSGLIATRLAAVCFAVLLIACANVTSLLLARSLERRRELAVRLAMGVTTARLGVQLFIESMLLVGLASLVALLVVMWCGSVLQQLVAPELALDGAVFDRRLLLTALVAVMIISIGVTLFPLVHLHRNRSLDPLRSGTRISSSGVRTRNVLTVIQTAVAVILLVGAGMCLRSLQQVLSIQIGMDVDRLTYARPVLLNGRGGSDPSRRAELPIGLTAIARDLHSHPSVERISLSSHAPFGSYSMVPVRVSASDSEPKLNGFPPATRNIDGNYWHVVGMRATRGRLFDERSVRTDGLVIVINESMARHVWKDASPLGQCVYLYTDNLCRTIIGVVADVRTGRVVEQQSMQMYTPLSQGSRGGKPITPSTIIVRARSGQLAQAESELARAVDRAFINARPGLQTLSARIELQYQPWKLGALLFSAMGILGTFVAAIGLYGVLAYSVRQRMHEMGIRVALGAQTVDVMRLVTARGTLLTIAGIVSGIAIAAWSAKFIEPILYLQPSRDLMIYACVSVAMLCAGLLATVAPARRAARADPMVTLRTE
jgi:putative ABC transport system permease protein